MYIYVEIDIAVVALAVVVVVGSGGGGLDWKQRISRKIVHHSSDKMLQTWARGLSFLTSRA